MYFAKARKYEVRERFDEKFLKSAIKYQMRKVYVCGSPQFEEQIMDSLQAIGVERKLIL